MKKIILILCCFLFLLSPALHSQNAPVTTMGHITNALPNGPAVPVALTVTNFINVGQLTLTMLFDTTRVHFLSANINTSLTGMTVTYTHPTDNTQGKIVFTWTGGSNISLADGASLADLTFSYVTGTGILSWAYTFGSVCQYQRYVAGVLTALSDTPKYLFYMNGGISNRAAPVTFAPVITNPVQGSLSVPVIVNGFNNIGTLTLYLEYDPSIITYNSFTKNPAFGYSFEVGDNPGNGDKRIIIIQWFDTTVSLSNGATLCTLFFLYPVPVCNSCALSWYDNGSSCEYTDGSGDVLIDMPVANYYKNGIVEGGVIVSWTGNISSTWNDAGNWNACGIPDITRDIIIPDVSPHPFPIVTIAGYCRSLRIENGATLTVSPTGSIKVGKVEY